MTAGLAGAAVAVSAPLALLPHATAQPDSDRALAAATDDDPGALTDLIISEYVEGTSNNKAIEIYNGTGQDVSLAGYQLVQYSNGGTNPGNTISLDSTTTVPHGEVFVVAHTQWALEFEPDQRAGGLNYNGNDAIVLRKDGIVVDSFGQVGDDPGAAGWGTPPVNTTDNTLRRLANVCAGDTVIDDEFDPADEYTGHGVNAVDGLGSHTSECEPGAEPPPPPPPHGSCGDPVTPIGEVQGTAWEPALLGQTVSIEGVVIGDFQHAGGFNGYFIQDEGEDNPLTSDAVFVNTTLPADVGDQVRITGLVGNDFNQTRITPTSADTVTVCASGLDLPAPTVLELPLTDQERWSHESMLVVFEEDLTILEYFNYGRFGEIALGTERQYQPTHLFDPRSDDRAEQLEYNLAHRITLDDGLGIQNPAFLRHPNGQPFSIENRFRGGDLVTNVTGVLDYRFNLWRIQPTIPADFTVVNERPLQVPDVGGDTTVVAFNVLNYFTDLDGRGAISPEEFERQETKIVAALIEMDADIAGLIEIENNDDEAVATLTAAVNEELGAEVYDYLATGDVGTDAITTAFIYKKDEVAPVGDFALLDQSVDERFLDSRNRPVLAQTFSRLVDGVPTGEPITVANNHLKSKGSACTADGDPEDPFGQGNCNGVRTDAAEAMMDWLATDPTDSGADNVLVIGDLNSYAQEDPIVAMAAAGYVDLLWDRQGPEAYTYVFDGQLGYLDYALASADADALVTGADAWYINADEPSVLDYTLRFKPPAQQEIYEPNAFRSSDHDPVIVGLQLLEDDEEPGEPVERISGDDRYDTAARLALSLPDSDVVFLASGQDFPDALTAAAPAARDAVPVLLTRTDRLPAFTEEALQDLAPQQIYVFGGTSAVNEAVTERVAEVVDAEIIRIDGANRFDTAARVAQEFFDAAEVDTVYIASHGSFADALAGAPLAGSDESPVLLSRPDRIAPETAAALQNLAPERIVVLGGETRIGDTVLQDLRGYADEVERLAGANRFETAAVISEQLPASDGVILTFGGDYADALAAGPFAVYTDAPILLTRTEVLPDRTAMAITDREAVYATVLGGEDVVAQAVIDALLALLQD